MLRNMNTDSNTENGNAILIIVGIIAILFLIGFFRSAPAFWDTVNYKTILRLPCGVTVKHPSFGKNEVVAFPLQVDGYINGCGWEPMNGSAGTVQIFDGKGLPVTDPTPLTLEAPDAGSPYYFNTSLVLSRAPTAEGGNILLRSNTGLLYPIPVSF